MSSPVSFSPNSQRNTLSSRFQRVRQFSLKLIQSLTPEDCVVQSMPDASPTNWHLAHTTWFFETMILARDEAYERLNDEYAFLYNSYYNSLGPQFPRPQRGLITRPGLSQIIAYREYVDRYLLEILDDGDLSEIAHIVEIGLHHEQQHQELLLTDIKHALSRNPLGPAFLDSASALSSNPKDSTWVNADEGVFEIGFAGPGFSYDNESPRHRQYIHPFSIASRTVTNREFIEFIHDDGYRRPEFWLSAGWTTTCEQSWRAPLYWVQRDGDWWNFTLSGIQLLDLDAPVCHISYFEADAYARWRGARLPTEAEWEVVASQQPITGNFADELLARDAPLHPTEADDSTADAPTNMYGNVWEWTSSHYSPYPGYQPPDGALGEYNGKFMCNQFVLRGGSCATSRDHIRPTYRNFFGPDARWQFSGLRLAKSRQ